MTTFDRVAIGPRRTGRVRQGRGLDLGWHPSSPPADGLIGAVAWVRGTDGFVVTALLDPRDSEGSSVKQMKGEPGGLGAGVVSDKRLQDRALHPSTNEERSQS